MDEQLKQVSGLATRLIGDTSGAKLVVVMLHGYAMRATDLTSFAHSLSIPNVMYAFPQASTPTSQGGFAWWPINEDVRANAIARGPRDLHAESPPGRREARAQLRAFLDALRRECAAPVLLCGFSQGAMLALDSVLLDPIPVAAMALMSSSRIALQEWLPRRNRLCGQRIFVSHGRRDQDLAFSAGEELVQFLEAGGASVTWLPFDGGHEIPFTVWRQFRSFARATVGAHDIQGTSRRYATH